MHQSQHDFDLISSIQDGPHGNQGPTGLQYLGGQFKGQIVHFLFSHQFNFHGRGDTQIGRDIFNCTQISRFFQSLVLIFIGHLTQNGHPNDFHTIHPQQFQIQRYGVTETHGMDKGPKAPGTPQGWPQRHLDILEDFNGTAELQDTNNHGIGGIQKNGPHGQIRRDFNARGPPRTTKIQVRFHKKQPIMTEWTMTNKTRNATPQGTW
mmetsp:Transcript_36126/g.75140  ORF Transcript_36126/g.75140 Transcript_36126/m.75140 type:complete len:207 (+) Transcript_36126:1305-1925(+)